MRERNLSLFVYHVLPGNTREVKKEGKTMKRLDARDKNTLELLLQNHVPKTKIAQVIGVSRKSIYYHIQQKEIKRNDDGK